ncbi:AP-5 complex subunit beta-1 [Candoia aspera]|uniref:AP-5 complex subunit beta-1 n=1 Tax=Candoia aspera TaxID=51853 RepID=UPI002FD7C92D
MRPCPPFAPFGPPRTGLAAPEKPVAPAGARRGPAPLRGAHARTSILFLAQSRIRFFFSQSEAGHPIGGGTSLGHPIVLRGGDRWRWNTVASPVFTMGSRGGENWAGTVDAFRLSPTAFLLSHGAGDSFAADLLNELRSERLGEPIKLSMLALFLEYPTLMCPDAKTGQEAAASLLALFAQLNLSPKHVSLRCNLLFAAETVLVATDGLGEDCPTSHELLSILLHLVSDLNDGRGGATERPVRAAACECLRELECCYSGFLLHRLEILRSLQQQEISGLHQGYTLLYSEALRNAVLLLARSGQGCLGELLASNGDLMWEATKEVGKLSPACIEQLVLLPCPADLKELKLVLSALLDSSYLLTPAAQSHLLWRLAQAVSVVRTQSPAIFKAQLVRLFGTASVTLEHAVLLLKSLFTDSLFTSEDESFLLRHLVGLAQHPALPDPVKLFHLDCLLHFPENRPLVSGTDERLPVLLTPRTTSGLFPGFFQDQGTVLARMNLLSLVCIESEGPSAERGAGYLLDHVLALGGLVTRGGGLDATRLFFRAAFIFAQYFGSRAQPMAELIQCLLDLYRQNCTLAPNIINLLDESWKMLEESNWARTLARALQEFVVSIPLQEKDLGWHLKILARLAKEKDVPQGSTMQFLAQLVASGKLGDWRSGQILLSVCRNLMVLHPSPALSQLAALLHAISLGHTDVDVQDRACFYHTLLTNLSSEKLRAVLAPEGPVKTRTLSSSIVADSESFVAALTVHPVEPAPLRLQRVEISGDTPPEPPAEQEVDGYCQWLLATRSPSRLSLAYQLVHAGPGTPPYDLLLCVVLRFTCASPHYEPVPELCVPCLSAHRPSPTVRLTLQPRCPYPTRLTTSALYTTQDGLTRLSQLETLEVAFPDLFLPLPVPAWSSEKLHHLFDALWQRMHPDAEEAHAESLTVWPLPPRSLEGLVHDQFRRFILTEQANSYGIALTLPPRYHILLQVQSVEDAARVSIRTDNWKLLPSLNHYLQSLVKAS